MADQVVKDVHVFFDQQYADNQNQKFRFDVETARAMVRAYMLHYSGEHYIVRGVEVPFTLPLPDYRTGGYHAEPYGGVIDLIVEDTRTGAILFGDHKTASNTSDSYWYELETNPQITDYFIAGKQCDIPVEGFLYDVVSKTTISPKKLTKAAKKELETGSYLGYPLPPGYYAGEEDETPKLFGLRAFQWYMDNAQKVFQRRTVGRTDAQLLQRLKRKIMWADKAQMLLKGELEPMAAETQCKRYGKLCPYHQICSHSDPDKLLYQPIPPRPDSEQKTGASALSHSRQSVLERCELEYTYQYGEKIELRHKEYQQALELGTLFHKGLEIWLLSRLERPITLPNGESE